MSGFEPAAPLDLCGRSLRFGVTNGSVLPVCLVLPRFLCYPWGTGQSLRAPRKTPGVRRTQLDGWRVTDIRWRITDGG